MAEMSDIIARLLPLQLTFGRDDGSRPYCTTVELAAGGRVVGYQNPHEVLWRIDDGRLALSRADGMITTRFDEIVEDSPARIILRGYARVSGAQKIYHILTGYSSSTILQALRAELYSGVDPFAIAQTKYVDRGYPHSNLSAVPEMVESVLQIAAPSFWLEIGSMLGGSAIVTAAAVKRLGLRCGIVAIDPFCGDVNMWAWEHNLHLKGEWRFLRLEDGESTIYRRFLANVMAAGHHDIILPITTTSIVGIKLLLRLHREQRIDQVPSVIYLDSAHEPDETFLELRNAWDLLPSGGVLLGDDWSWNAVRTDVSRFAATVTQNPTTATALRATLPGTTGAGNVMLYKGQWLLLK